MYTLADATDERHLAEIRFIVRERKAAANDALKDAKREVAGHEYLCIEAIKLGLLDDTLALAVADLKAAKERLIEAEAEFYQL